MARSHRAELTLTPLADGGLEVTVGFPLTASRAAVIAVQPGARAGERSV